MIYRITTKNCEISTTAQINLDRHISKLAGFLSQFADDLPLLTILLRGYKRKNYYDGSIILQLPKKVLFVIFTGENTDEAINQGFAKLMKKLKTYKGLHFKSHSEFYDHRSIKNIK